MFCVRQQIGNVLRGVAGSMPCRDNHGTEPEGVTIRDFFVFKTVTRTTFVTDINLRGLNPTLKLPRSANEICMNMRLEDMSNGDVFCTRQFQINVNVRSWIKDRRDAFFVIAD